MTNRRSVPTLLALTTVLLALSCSRVNTNVASSPSVERPATPDDLRILERADQILSDSTKWDRADDRICNPSDTTWSLFCAVEKATVEVLGAYHHEDRMGQAATREVRRVVEELSAGREFQHRLMDYNNLPTTSFEDIKRVLHLSRERVAKQLAGRAR